MKKKAMQLSQFARLPGSVVSLEIADHADQCFLNRRDADEAWRTLRSSDLTLRALKCQR